MIACITGFLVLTQSALRSQRHMRYRLCGHPGRSLPDVLFPS